MQVKEAVDVAKDYVLNLFGDDGLTGLRLEEIERGNDGAWNITVGFSRPLAIAADTYSKAGELLNRMRGETPVGPRVYRVVKVRDADGEVLSVKIREGLD